MRHSREKELILSCLQSIHCSRACARCTETIANSLDWNWILKVSAHANISSLFIHQLRSLGLDGSVPTDIRRKLERHYYAVGHRNSLILRQTDELCRKMADAGVDMVVLKGTALQVDVWRNLSLREIGDVDLLVRPEDLVQAENVLRDAGYLPIENFQPADYYRRHHHHLAPYFHPKAACRIPVEIHHDIAQPKGPNRLPMKDFWKSAREIEFDHCRYRVLSPENLLMHLCIQMSFLRNFLGQIRYCMDISQAAARFGSVLDWDYVVETAFRYRIINYIYYSLYFSGYFAKAPIPQNMLERMKTQVSVRHVSHRMLDFLVKRYMLMPFPDEPLIPGYKLRLCIRDIMADASFSKRFATVWNEVPVVRRIGIHHRSIFLIFSE